MTEKKEFDELYMCGQAIIKALEAAYDVNEARIEDLENNLKVEENKKKKLCAGIEELLNNIK